MKLQSKPTPLFSLFLSVFNLALLFLGLRLFSVLLHRRALLKEPVLDILSRFLFTFSLDLLFFLVWNSFYVFFCLFCERLKKDQAFLFRKIFFYLLNLPVIILFFLDMQTLAVQNQLFYFSLLTALKTEMLLNFHVFIMDYWYFAVFSLGILYVFFRYFPVLVKKSMSGKEIFLAASISIYFCFLSGLFLLQFQSLPFQDEYRYNGFLIRLVHAIHGENRGCETRFFSKSEVLKTLNRKPLRISKPDNPEFENVILFIIESLSGKYIQPHLMPFLADKAKRGVFLKNHYTPSLATISSTFSLLNGAEGGDGFRERSFFTDFKETGYTVSFFFGDTGAAFGVSDMIKKMDITDTFFREDYLKETGRTKDLDKEGNVYENPFLDFAAKKIKRQNPPFFSIILTNQIHLPFFCSPELKITDSLKKRHVFCLNYMDQALKNFLATIENMDWFHKTLFLFTGDHPDSFDFVNSLDRADSFALNHIPLILYHPKKNLKKYESNEVSGHMDIIPSLMDYLSLPYQRHSFLSNSIFSPDQERRFFTKRGDYFVLIEDDYVAKYNCVADKTTLYLKNDREESEVVSNQKLEKNYDKLIKSYIQYEYEHKR